MTLPKLKYWYHATTIELADKIIASGYLVPQPHKDNMSLGVFFANTLSNAGHWLAIRGHSEYVVFKIPRSRLNTKEMRIGGADRMPKELNMICMRHLDIVPVTAADMTPVNDNRTFEIPGVEIFTVGTKKLGMKVVDLAAFEAYIEANPKLKEMIAKELEAAE